MRLHHRALLVMTAGLTAVPALAHGQHPMGGEGFSAGLTHPWMGLDHLLAMVTVGLLAVRSMGQQQRLGLWVVPLAFVSLMSVGAGAALLNLPLPGTEWAIASSVIVLGLVTAALPRVPVAAAATIVALFATFHGYAHIQEMTGGIAPYAAGMLLGTVALHVLGLALGAALMALTPSVSIRYAGAAFAAGFAATLIF